MNRYEEMLKESHAMGEMYIPKDGDTIRTIHQITKQKTAWYLSGWKSMPAQNVPTNPELVTYRSKIYPYHGLHRSLLTTVTPEIRAADGYQICFCENPFINMVKEFRWSFNDTEFYGGNTKSLKIALHKSGLWGSKLSEAVGNTSQLIEWNYILPSQKLAMYMPWSYAKDKSDYFPLQLCGSNDNLSHIIEFNLEISNLILVREVESGDIVRFHPDMVEVVGNLERIPIPEMEGLYSSLPKDTCKHNICVGDDGKEPIYYAHSLYYLEEENEIPFGKKGTIKFDSKKNQPVNRIEWGTVNVKESDISHDLVFTSSGVTPVKKTSLDTSVETFFRDVDSFKTEEAYDLLTDEPYLPGISVWKNSVLLREDGRKFVPAVLFNGGNMSITLRERRSSDPEGARFLVFAILHYITEIRFTSFPKTQEERLKMGATIVVEEN